MRKIADLFKKKVTIEQRVHTLEASVERLVEQIGELKKANAAIREELELAKANVKIAKQEAENAKMRKWLKGDPLDSQTPAAVR